MDRRTDRQIDRQTERNLSAVCWVVEVILRVWVRHASWVAADDVEIDAGRQSSFAMPLYLYVTSQSRVIVRIHTSNLLFTLLIHVVINENNKSSSSSSMRACVYKQHVYYKDMSVN